MLGGESLLKMEVNTIVDIINEHGIYNLENLNNKPCVVFNENGIIRFVRLHK